MIANTSASMVTASMLSSKSRSEAKRLIKQGAVKINQQTITDGKQIIKKNDIIQVGKRKWVKIK